jgi:hypothetical protein
MGVGDERARADGLDRAAAGERGDLVVPNRLAGEGDPGAEAARGRKKSWSRRSMALQRVHGRAAADPPRYASMRIDAANSFRAVRHSMRQFGA